MTNQAKSIWRNRWSSGSRWLERHSALPVVGLAAGAVFSAFVGVAIARWELLFPSDGVGVVRRFANWLSVCIYEAIQVLVLNMSPQAADDIEEEGPRSGCKIQP
jgi:hypothetical protein